MLKIPILGFSASDSDSDSYSDVFNQRSPDKYIKDIGPVDGSFDLDERGVRYRTNLKSVTRHTWAWQATPFFQIF